MVEISRVLRPGGIFVASTFLKSFSQLGELLGDDTVRPLNQVQPCMTCSHAQQHGFACMLMCCVTAECVLLQTC